MSVGALNYAYIFPLHYSELRGSSMHEMQRALNKIIVGAFHVLFKWNVQSAHNNNDQFHIVFGLFIIYHFLVY